MRYGKFLKVSILRIHDAKHALDHRKNIQERLEPTNSLPFRATDYEVHNIKLHAKHPRAVPRTAMLMLTLVKAHQRRHMRIHETVENIFGMSRWQVCICIIYTYITPVTARLATFME